MTRPERRGANGSAWFAGPSAGPMGRVPPPAMGRVAKRPAALSKLPLITLILALSVMIWPVAIQGQEEGVLRSEPTRGVVRVTVDVFEKVEGEERFSVLERGIPAALTAALLSYDNIEVVAEKELVRARARLEAEKKVAQSPRAAGETGDSLLQPEVLIAAGVDYVIGGRFVVQNAEIQLLPTLRKVAGVRAIVLDTIKFDAQEVFDGVEELALAIAARISGRIPAPRKAEAPRKRLLKLAVACFENDSAKPDSALERAIADLAQHLASHFKERENTEVLKWEQVKEFCSAPDGGPALMREYEIGLVITGRIELKGNTLVILPRLVIKGETAPLAIPGLRGEIESYLELKERTAERIKDYLDALLTPEGTWQAHDLIANQGNAASLVERGEEVLTQGDANLAALFFDMALDLTPDDTAARLLLGKARFAQERFDEAAQAFSRAVAEKPDLAEAHEALGDTYLRLEEYDKAIAAYEAALPSHPSGEDIYFKIGNIYRLRSDYDKAMVYLGNWLYADRKDLERYFLLTDVAAQFGEQEDAIYWLTKALKVAPNDAKVRKRFLELVFFVGFDSYSRKQYETASQKFTYMIDNVDIGTARNEEERDLLLMARFGRALSSFVAEFYSGTNNYSRVIEDYFYVIGLTKDDNSKVKLYVESLLNLAEVFIISDSHDEAIARAQEAVHVLRKIGKSTIIPRYLLVVSQILRGKSESKEMERLQWLLESGELPRSTWSFKILKRFFELNKAIGRERQNIILDLNNRMETALARGSESAPPSR